MSSIASHVVFGDLEWHLVVILSYVKLFKFENLCNYTVSTKKTVILYTLP